MGCRRGRSLRSSAACFWIIPIAPKPAKSGIRTGITRAPRVPYLRPINSRRLVRIPWPRCPKTKTQPSRWRKIRPVSGGRYSIKPTLHWIRPKDISTGPGRWLELFRDIWQGPPVRSTLPCLISARPARPLIRLADTLTAPGRLPMRRLAGSPALICRPT